MNTQSPDEGQSEKGQDLSPIRQSQDKMQAKG